MTTQATIDATAPEESPQAPEARAPAPLGDLLDQLCRLFDIKLAPNQLASVLNEACGEVDHEWSWRLISALEGIGLSGALLELDALDAYQTSKRSEGALITRIASGWLILTGVHRGKGEATFVEDSGRRRAARVELSSMTAMIGEAPNDWVVAETRLPMQAMSMGKVPFKGPSASKAIKRLKSLLVMEREALGAVVVYAILIGLLGLLTPIAVQALVNTIAFGVVLQPLIMLALVVLVGLAFVGSLRLMQHYVVEFIQRRIFVRLVTDLAHRLPRVNVSAHEKYYMPELVNRFFDVITVQKAAATILLDTLGLVLQMGIGMLVLAFYHPYLLAFSVVLTLAVFFVIFVLGRGGVTTSIHESDAKYKMAAWLEEIARHPMSFKSRRGSKIAADHADQIALEWLDARGEHFRVLLRQITGAVVVQAVAAAGLLGLGGWLVLRGQLTLGQLVAAELIVTTVASSIAKMGKHLETYYDLTAGVYKVGKLLDLPLERDVGELPRARRSAAAISLEDVCIDRGSSRLKNIALEVTSGERVGLIGCDGAGTSTLLESLYGLRQMKSGVARFDGTPFGELAVPALRDEISLVREWDVFDGTIEENVRMGQRDLAPQVVRDALDAVGLLEELDRLDEGLQTRLVAHGAPLSPDQLNRLMIARALLEQPRLMLIDRALDGVRPERLEATLESLLGRDAPWSALVVSHRPEVLRYCDRVLELTEGGLVEAAPPSPRGTDGEVK